MIKLEFHTDDLALQDLANKYWALNDSGLWVETVDAISKATGIPKPKIPKIVKETASAYLLTLLCSVCKKPTLVSSRSDYASLRSHSKFLSGAENAFVNREFNYSCSECQQIKRSAEIQLQQNREHEKRQKVSSVLQEISNRKYDYSCINFIDAVYAYSIKQASGDDRIKNAGVIGSTNIFIVPTFEKQVSIFKNLFDSGILHISMSSNLSAFDVGDKGLTYLANKVSWTFTPDLNDFEEEVIDQFIINALEIPDVESLCGLWRDVAQYECESYFYQLCDQWGLKNWSYTETVSEAINYALKNYSIAQVWGLMHSETKNLAALVQAGNYNKRHIENMFPGSLRKRADRYFANKYQVTSWRRRAFDKECYLSSILFDNLFGGGDADWENINLTNLKHRAEEVFKNALTA